MRRMVLGLAALLLATALAGCADDDDEQDDAMDGMGDGMDDGMDHGDGDHMDEGGGNLPVNGSEDVVINVTAGSPVEFRFTPDRIEVLAGQRVAISFTNNGLTAHEFDIEDLDFHLHAEPGETVEAAFIAPPAGEHEIACHISGHYEAGMRGTLVVAEDAMSA